MVTALTSAAACRNFIGGKWVESEAAQFLEGRNPTNTDEVVAPMPFGGIKDTGVGAREVGPCRIGFLHRAKNRLRRLYWPQARIERVLMPTTKKLLPLTLPAFFLLFAFASLPHAFAANKPIIWKPVNNAILEVTGRKPPKTWSVLEDDKQKSRVLVELDNRYLMLDAKTKQVFEISPSQVQPHGKNFQSADPSDTERALPTTDWDMRDLGPAERIEVRLINDNTKLDVQLPHPLDLRVPLH